jgi:tetratricopeptide (TPR) repeat protein
MKRAATKARKGEVKGKTAAGAGRQARAEALPPVQKGKQAGVAPADKPSLVIGPQEQSRLFEQAVGLFHGGNFAQAKRLFERAAGGPVREVAHVARVHVRICEKRLGEAAPAPVGVEGLYDYAIALINQRELDAAERHLQQALKLAPNADHVHYALALARGLRGEILLACESLRRAIEIDPRNRAHARNDPDFAEFSHHPQLAALLFPDREHRA